MGSYSELLANPTWYYTAAVAALCGVGLMLAPLLVPSSWPRPPITAMLTLMIVAASFWTIAGNRSGSRIALGLILVSMGLVAFEAPAAWPKTILLAFMAVLALITAYFVVRFLPQKELPSQIRWRKSTHIGICFGVAGMVGLWGIAFFSPELITAAFKNRPLMAREIVQPAVIFAGLKTPANSGVTHVKGQLSAEVQKLVDQIDPAAALPAAAQETLLTDLNRLIQNDEPLQRPGVPVGDSDEGDVEFGEVGPGQGREAGHHLDEPPVGGAALPRRDHWNCKRRSTSAKAAGRSCRTSARCWAC